MPPSSPWFDRPPWRRLIVSTLGSIVLASLVMLALLWRRDRDRNAPSAERYAFTRPDEGALPTLWKAPSFSLVDQAQHPVTLDSLRGEPFVADFIYTQCTSACPMLTSKMVMLQRSLGGEDVRFVSFSVDPAHDTPAALAAYAARWNERETRWSLLATTDASLDEVAAGFRETTKPTGDAKDPILHSTFMFLVDKGGFVRGVYPSNEGDMMARLAADVRQLTPTGGTTKRDASSSDLSKDLYTSFGCPGCHADPKLAPPLVNLLGAERMLQDGRKITIDDAYLRKSILDPGADVVAGYAPLMPSYHHPLSEADVDALVVELEARKAAVAGAPDPVALVIDPVCHMQIRATPDAPHVTSKGKDVYFCSDMCKETFEEHPERYSSEPMAGAKH